LRAGGEFAPESFAKRTVMRYKGLLLAFLIPASAMAQGPAAQPVLVVPIVERDVHPSIRLVGSVLAQKSALVAAETSGLLAEFPAEEGQFLQAGEVICRIDDTVARLWVEESQAELAALEARLEELENGTREEVVRQLKAAAAETEAMCQKWKFERDRIVGLTELRQASAKEAHDSEMELLAAERRRSQASAAYEAAVNGPRPEEVARARHDVAAKRAALARLTRDLEKTRVCAPFAGFVVSKRTEIGEWIEAGGPVCDMVAIDHVKVRVDAPESAIPFCLPGRPASVEIEALQETRAATITRRIPRAVESARTFPIEIDLDNADHRLLPGMFVWTYAPSGPIGKRLMVSKDAVVPRGASKTIYVIRPGQGGSSLAIPTQVTTGMEIGGQIAIEGAGLAAGDLAVCRANERLYGPTPVIPRPFADTPAPDAAPARDAAQGAEDAGGGEGTLGER